MSNNLYPTLIGGDYAIDYLILSKLSLNKILILSNRGDYFSPICADNYFWYLVATYHFPGVIPTSGTTWFQLIKFLTSSEIRNINRGLNLAAQSSNISLVKYFINKGADNWDWAMCGAACGGHKDLVEFFISKGANLWDVAMLDAAPVGQQLPRRT